MSITITPQYASISKVIYEADSQTNNIDVGFPLDCRTLTNCSIGNSHFSSIENINYPYIGLITYDAREHKMFLIKSVKNEESSGNYKQKVDVYTEFMGLPHYPSADQTGFIPQVSDDDITEINWVDPSGIIYSCINDNETIKNSIGLIVGSNTVGYDSKIATSSTKYSSVTVTDVTNFTPSAQYKIYEYTITNTTAEAISYEIPAVTAINLDAGFYKFELWVKINSTNTGDVKFSYPSDIYVSRDMIADEQVLTKNNYYVFERTLKIGSNHSVELDSVDFIAEYELK